MSHVVVLGAGVIGLQTAIYLLEARHKVTMVAAHFPADKSIEYTSPWAGAHWRTHASEDDVEQQQWDLATFAEWARMIEAEEANPQLSKCGLKFYDSLNYWDTHPSNPPWWTTKVPNYRSIDPETRSDIPSRVSSSSMFTSIAVNVPQYLDHLLNTAIRLGAKTIRQRIAPPPQQQTNPLAHLSGSIAHILRSNNLPPADCILNATALGSLTLCNDHNLHPVRGITVLVRGEASAIRTHLLSPSGIAYVIPRPGSGTTVLGGTKDEGAWEGTERADAEAEKRILEKCRVLAPELLGKDGFEVIGRRVGLRPGRTGGARMEGEWVEDQGVRMPVVHAYGHSGAGFQNSVGAARKAVRLVREMLASSLAKL